MTLHGRGLRALSIATVIVLVGAFALAAFYAPEDADQGVIQKIFYVHVPMAIVALCGFVAGGIFAIRHLRSGDRADDLRSYVAIHLSLILAASEATAPLFAAGGAEALPGRWVAVLGIYDLIFGLIAYGVFDFLLED